MKRLTTTLLTLLISGGLWADDLSFDLFAESFDSKLDCLRAIKSARSNEDGVSECREYKNLASTTYQIKIINVSTDVKQSYETPVKKVAKKGLCFGPRGQLEENKAYCSRQEGWVKQDRPNYFEQKRNNVAVEKKPEPNFFGELLGAFISGAIEGAIIGAISEPCVPEVKVRTSQTVAGAPQYGTKTRTTIKPCTSPYKLK